MAGEPDYAPLSTHEAGRLILAHIGLRASNELTRAIERAVRVSARTLNVERVSVWLFEDHAVLRCLALYTLSTNAMSAGQTLDTTPWPAYLAALQSRKFISAHDACADARTCELRADYLVPLGITSMLDAPVFRRGEVTGVVCHEHVGSPRVWTERESDFAASVSDMLTAIFEQARALTAEEKLHAEGSRLARVAHWETLGRLAAGVAHDFNGVLGVAMNTAAIVRRHPDTPEDIREQADALARYADYGRRLVSQLASFARQDSTLTDELDLGEAIRAMRALLGASARDHVLDVALPTAHLRAHLSRGHLEQILVNLVLNACDASPRGSTVHIAVAEETADGKDWVVVRVSDHGVGIDPAARDQLFEPFFSTKSGGHEGMGLAIVRGIARNAGGDVSVESSQNGGSTFVVRLPAT